jgi:hypothetical protein
MPGGDAKRSVAQCTGCARYDRAFVLLYMLYTKAVWHWVLLLAGPKSSGMQSKTSIHYLLRHGDMPFGYLRSLTISKVYKG